MKYRFLVLLLVVFNHGYFAQDKEQTSCMSAKCHASMADVKYLHGPFAVKECNACHVPIKDQKHKFEEIKKPSDLCMNCHEPLQMKKVVHGPLKTGSCTACHSPHGSNQQFMLKKSQLSEMCMSCHKKEMFDRKNVHPPVMDGDCTVCHEPHSSDNEKLLVKAGNSLCYTCHTDFESGFANSKFIHKPASEKCTNCHDVHSSDFESMTLKETKELCYKCHAQIKQTVADAASKHSAVDEGKKCANCHSPHFSDVPKLLKKEPLDLCVSCHNDQLTTRNASLTNFSLLLQNNKDWHGPIQEKDCSGCHGVHGGKTDFRLLNKSYPNEFYTSYAKQKYELCFGCHQPTLAQDSITATLTNFRDGDKNLHFLHVNKRVKGRTCRACHETHASKREKHIREAVPFGKWQLPVNFEKNKDGGKCTPGCHAPKEYKRTLPHLD
ncbi:MAG: cytochrome c3 family protein [Bacteroidetes bacterium]|nr:cytochrome c3 family protein [Bacteroidota bacterium]